MRELVFSDHALQIDADESFLFHPSFYIANRTAIWVAEQMTRAKFEVKENVDGTEQCLIICEGAGMEGRL